MPYSSSLECRSDAWYSSKHIEATSMKGKPVEYQDSGSSISELTDNFSSYTSFSCVQQKQVLVYFNHISRVFWSLQPKSFLHGSRCLSLGHCINSTNQWKSTAGPAPGTSGVCCIAVVGGNGKCHTNSCRQESEEGRHAPEGTGKTPTWCFLGGALK